MKKIIILMIMMLITITSVFGIAPDSTLRINAEYKEVGIFTDANANITITLPNGTIDVDNIAMTDVSTGRFYYDYGIGSTLGTYDVEIDFYNSTDLLSTETSTFLVEVATETVNSLFWAGLAICVILLIIGFVFSQGLVAIMGGLGMVFLSFMLNGAFFIITLVAGCLIALSALLIES